MVIRKKHHRWRDVNGRRDITEKCHCLVTLYLSFLHWLRIRLVLVNMKLSKESNGKWTHRLDTKTESGDRDVRKSYVRKGEGEMRTVNERKGKGSGGRHKQWDNRNECEMVTNNRTTRSPAARLKLVARLRHANLFMLIDCNQGAKHSNSTLP